MVTRWNSDGEGFLERTAHIQRLRQILDDESHKSLFDHLYASLSILDAKSASLLQFNSVQAAVFTLYLQGDKVPLTHFVVGVVGIAAALVSCYWLLNVVWVPLVDQRPHDEF